MKSRRLADPRLLVSLLPLLAAACATETEQPLEQASSAATACSAESPIVELGDLPVIFVDNHGQAAQDVQYQGIGLGAGTLAITSTGVRLDLPDVAGVTPLPAATVLVEHEGSAAFHPTPTAPSALDSTTTFVTTAGTISDVPNHGALAQRDFYPGIDLELGGTLRMLVTTYTVKPGASASALLWSYGGASVAIDPGVGSLRITVDGARDLSLGPPVASQILAGETVAVEAHYTVSSGSVGVALGTYDPSQPVVIRTRLLHGPAFEASGTVTSSGGAVLAAGRAYRAASGDEDTAGDAYVAELTDDGHRLGSTTFVIGEAEDEAHAVAVAANGDLLVAGTTRSTAFPTLGAHQPALAGGADGFVVRLDPTGGAVLAATYLGSAGDEAATGLAEAPNGSVLVVSTRTTDVKAVKPGSATFTTHFPTGGASPTDVPYSVTALAGALSGVAWAVPFHGARLRRPRLWLDCHGRAQVGIRGLRTPDCAAFPDLRYEMSEYGENYAQDQAGSTFGWGYHALRWKQYYVNDATLPGYTHVQTSLTFSPPYPTPVPNVVPPQPPSAGVSHDEAYYLNYAEYNPDPGPWFFTPTNPRGEWEMGDHDGFEHLALKSALVEQRWRTPLYTGMRSYSGPGSSYVHPVVVERTTLDVCIDPGTSNYNGESIEDLCVYPGGTTWFGDVDCTTPGIHGVTFGFTLGASSWNEPWPTPSYYHEHFDLPAIQPGTSTDWYTPGMLVFDPPAEDLQATEALDEMTARLAGLVTVTVPTVERAFDKGVPGAPTDGSVIARVVDAR